MAVKPRYLSRRGYYPSVIYDDDKAWYVAPECITMVRHMYEDHKLSLNQIARRHGIPVRKVRAILAQYDMLRKNDA